MFATYVSIALLAASSASGLVVPRAPHNWWKGLESYSVYNARYDALGCAQQHNTAFFDTCCHPLLKSQSLSSRPAKCNPASVSATLTATSAAASETDDDCDDGSESSSATVTATSAVPTTTDDGDDGCIPCDDDNDPDCVDVPVLSSSAVSVTSVPTSTLASSTPAATSTPVSSKSATSFTPVSTPASSSSKPAPSSSARPIRTVSPKPTPTPTQPTTTSSKASATTTASGSSGTTVTGGFATFFWQNGVAGACGTVHSDDALIAAIDAQRYGDTGRVSSLCGQQVEVTNLKSGKSVTVTIEDACPTCANNNSIDLSHGAFDRIATDEEGMVDVSLRFL